MTDSITTRAGIRCEFNKGTSDGVNAVLYPEAHHTDADVQSAKAEARKARDIVSIRVRRLGESGSTD
jgi:hypothetical protein